MKRLLLIIVLLIIPVLTFAQRGIPRTNSISVSSTIVTKKKTVFSEDGFQHFVEIGSKIDLIDEFKGATGVNYIGGYRFNNYLFAGVGIGLEFSHCVAEDIKEHVGKSTTCYSPVVYVDDSFVRKALNMNPHYEHGSLNMVSIPIYVHLRGYYTKTKCSPYSSLSFGGVLAPKENGIYADFSTGVDVRLNNSNHLYFAVGFWYRRVRDTELGSTDWYPRFKYDVINYFNKGEDCHDTACDINFMYVDHYHLNVHDLYNRFTDTIGLSLHVGFAF